MIFSLAWTSCEKDSTIYPSNTEDTSYNESYLMQGENTAYHYVNSHFWYQDSLCDNAFPMGSSFAMFLNDSVVESSVELVVWSGDDYCFYPDELYISADSFYFTSNTGYRLDVGWELLSGSMDVDSMYGTWIFESGESGSEVLISSLRLYNAD